MLKAYFDDSDIGQPPVCVMGGWIAGEADWARFCDEWRESLGIGPKLDYFKLSEAASLTGQFLGWDAGRRNERVRYLLDIIFRFKPLGVASAVPFDLYKSTFDGNPDKFIRHPYFFLFNSVVVDLSSYLARQGVTEKIEFIFDLQTGQSDAAWQSWERLLASAPSEVRAILGDYPIFRDDKTTLPLQAADFCAGWLRERADHILTGRPKRIAAWADFPPELQCLARLWDEKSLAESFKDGV